MFKPRDVSGILVLLLAGGFLVSATHTRYEPPRYPKTDTGKQYVALRVLHNIFLHPLRRYPGPTLWAATRLTWVVALQRGHLHQDLLRLHDQYGPVVRIAPNELSYIDAQAWKDIYTSRPGHAVLERNPVWFRKMPTEPWSIMGYNEDAHARFRRAFMGAFSEKAVQDQSPLLEGYVETMIQRLRAIAGKGNATMAGKSNMTLAGSDENVAVVDAVSWLNFVTFDISADLSFGESFDSTSTGQPHPWVEIACRFGKGIALVASINHYGPLQSLLQRALPKKVREKMVYHRELSAHKVRQRLQLQEERPDFVNAVLKYNREKKENEVTLEELEVNMSVIVFAGSETTSTAMAGALFHLLKTPAAMDLVTEEVRGAFTREEEINVNSSSKLEYLSAVINEAMRLGPPSAISVPRVVPGEGAEICGRWVPGGVCLIMPA